MARGLGSGLRPHLMKRGLGGDGGIERLRLEMGYGGVPRQGEALQLVGVGTKKSPRWKSEGLVFIG